MGIDAGVGSARRELEGAGGINWFLSPAGKHR